MKRMKIFVCCLAFLIVSGAAIAQPDTCRIDPGDFCSYTQGGWGNTCNGGNPGCIRDANFATVFPAGLVVGGPGFTATFTSAAAIEAYLPNGGPSGSFTQNYVNPGSTSAGNLAAQTVALTLSVGFGNAGVLPDFDWLVVEAGPYAGMTVAQVLTLANAVLGGNLGGLPAGESPGTFNQLVTSLNENFDNCNSNDDILIKPGCEPTQDCPENPCIFVAIEDRFCLQFCGRPICVYWCCPLPGQPVFSVSPGCNTRVDGCNINCSPNTGEVTWEAFPVGLPAECPAPGQVWQAIFTATEVGCVCVTFERQLAAELLGFTAVGGNGQVNLDWSTASENNNDHFELLRDGIVIANVEGAYSSATRSDYHFVDRDLENGREYSYSLVAVSTSGDRDHLGSTNATPSSSNHVVTDFALYQNFPNPFNPSTMIGFDLVETASVRLTVSDPLGRVVATLVDGEMAAGSHSVAFNAGDLPSGVYLYSLQAGSFSDTKKLLLLK